MVAEDLQQVRPVGALVQSLRILRHLAAIGRPEGVNAIARAAGVNPSTCFNILRTLAAEGLVSFDAQDKSYRPALGLVELAVGVLGTNPGDLIRPELQRLADDYGVLMCLWHITGDDRIVLIERAFDPSATRVDLPLGKRLPAYTGGVGRVLAAHRALPQPEIHAHFEALRWQAAPSFEDYAASVTDAAQHGYAMDLGQLYVGVDVVGALIVDAGGVARYGISSISLAGQMDAAARRAIGEDLARTGLRLGAQLFALPATGSAPSPTLKT
ncbi:IclR family transcriptional regulator [Pararhodobacter sp. CCB-MM2]|uniref:IclR family transcriptional regulator n=1 Tax=Pararhodobacter sp. CCB-MM2 TaxID=1786003 RepID=UPI00082E0238|nr:IclR family transcriptional regulator [Pararhodobacter sp. CCB-MM2]